MNEREHKPICIECAYDQAGEIANWEDRCPIHGRCPECGLEFEWSQVYGQLDEWGSEIDWYCEHADGWGDLIRRTPRSMLRLIFPLWFFRDINHRRAIRLWMLSRWLLVMFGLLHVLVSLIGLPANRVNWAWSNVGAGYGEPWTASFLDGLCNAGNGILFPFAAVRQFEHGAFELRHPYMYDFDGWEGFMALALVLVGVTLAWSALMGAVFLLRWRGEYDRRHEFGLFGRVILLSLLPAMVYIEFVRLGFGIYAALGMAGETDWSLWVYLISFLVLVFWQQVLWTHAVRKIWQIKNSWAINIGGCFGSFIGGIFFTLWILT